MKILQRNLNRSSFVVWEMKRNVSVVCVCSAHNCCDTEQRSASQPASSVTRGTPVVVDFESDKIDRILFCIQCQYFHLKHCQNEYQGPKSWKTTKYDVTEETLTFVFRVLESPGLSLGHISGYCGYIFVIFLSPSSKIYKISFMCPCIVTCDRASWHVPVHRDKFLYNKTTRCTNFSNLFRHETLHV